MLFQFLVFLNMTTENKDNLIKKIFSLVGTETLTTDEALYLLMLIYNDKNDGSNGDLTSPGTIPYTPPEPDSIKPNDPWKEPWSPYEPYGPWKGPYTAPGNPYPWITWYTTTPWWEANKIYCNENNIDWTHHDTKTYNSNQK